MLFDFSVGFHDGLNLFLIERGFVLPQDTGAAIKGAGRADLFWGNGHYAETAAGNMKEQGQLYFLVKKDAKTNAKDMAAQLTSLQ